MMREQKYTDIHEQDVYTYSEDAEFYDEELDDDEIDLKEEGFMHGYLAA
ncbi:hypothetical protein J4457_07415 [Candidatus Woesearchaeota archaeon]|nr:hypothetical protein [Candidatus Woesearchaeota archaeon]